ncbi:MAG: arginine--tRNA ligase [Phreatobacter sp.]|uniref:arginine--tRNA ligase n=1 Tax=Phreatobacter sp. TaxID=1966341 RepID=UPI00273411A1|nr:arginine--tRNA ligase [Phreatobacter sp.]MDP2801241.1 arginine--tRNA ligase [Phreatobacter sp.]
MNIFALFTQHVRTAVAGLASEGIVLSEAALDRIVVEAPRDPTHGDLATNAAMVLSKEAGLKPRDLADKIAACLTAVPDVAKVDIAGPGFINLTVKSSVWPRVLKSAVEAGEAFGRASVGKGAKVNIEYVSANPTGPMHVGHCRGAVFGDALANLLDVAGFDVTREYYINDAGAQVQILGRSAHLRYREALGETITIPEGLYPGDYLKPVGEALKAEHGDRLLHVSEAEWLPICRDAAIAAMMEEIRGDLAALNVRHAVFFSERSLQAPVDKVRGAIASLRADGQIYEGVLERPKGADDDEWEEREQTLFRSTAFGDDVDRPLMKSDGSYTYFASDIAYHKDKADRGFLEQIDVWGADHGGYVKRMQAALKAISGGRAALDVKLVQLVRLFRDGEPVRMSKRSGDFVTLREVVDEVGRDAVRFMMLYRKNDATLDFDLAKVKEQSKDNPVFYVQYAHARGRSILRNAKAAMADLDLSAQALAAAPLDRLDDPGEIAIVQRLAQYPRLIEAAAQAHEPHRVAFYLYELASDLHSQWNRGKDSPHLRFIMENDRQITEARLALVQGIVTVLRSGLAILGVEAVEEMR